MDRRFADGTMTSIDAIAMENEVIDNMYERLELNNWMYNDPVGYADLIITSDLKTYMKTVNKI